MCIVAPSYATNRLASNKPGIYSRTTCETNGTSLIKLVSNHPYRCLDFDGLDISSVKKHVTIESTYVAAIFCFLLLSCPPAFGQTASLELRTKTGRTEFHVGEVILVDLLFVADTANAYERNQGISFPEYNPMPDNFSIEPSGAWVDPLSDYRKALFRAEHSGHFPIARATMSSKHVLGPEPYVLSLILNDYVRFSRPGHYILRVEDTGVMPITTGIGAIPEHLALTSNPLELAILPADSEWQQNEFRETLETFAQLQEVIDSHARSYSSSLDESCISLRAMGISDAGNIMVDSLRNEDLFSHCSFQAGILEFPHPKFILVQFRKRFNDPDFPVTYTFFNTMAMISLLAEGHADQLFSPNQEKIDRRLEQQLLSVVSLKRGEAKTETISTLVKMCFAAYGGDMGEFAQISSEPSQLNAQVLRVATANFNQLSPGVQKILKNYRKAHGLKPTGF
jgi:hypothetical protein